jgi:hypothetical protein
MIINTFIEARNAMRFLMATLIPPVSAETMQLWSVDLPEEKDNKSKSKGFH